MEHSVEELIQHAREIIERVVSKSSVDARTVIARYTSAFAINYTDWIGKTYPWARHELTQYTLLKILRCEREQNHADMLLLFADLSEAIPTEEHHLAISSEVRDIRNMLRDTPNVGLSGATLCAVLESASDIFISDLQRKAVSLGCVNLTYTETHGSEERKLNKAFQDAVSEELRMGYTEGPNTVCVATEYAINLICRIYG